MKRQKKPGFTELQADENKLLVPKGQTTCGAKAVVLAKSDSPENWEEIDELAEGLSRLMTVEEGDILEAPEYEIIPDEEGKIDYETAQKMQNDLQLLKRRMLEIVEKIAL
ncbi:hypothetical protein [Eubacterium sp. 1001713B170207_170306_E7]|uniref:hypothetical protein n=1 Tax=Eubacterium sp. 1001713B170207_170306_E7 TaxID=2787097 RepID=UPI0018972CAC|nr:hypothetical protein [Eubacterium sp. 1001713B170207_170306_E7]